MGCCGYYDEHYDRCYGSYGHYGHYGRHYIMVVY